MYQAGTLSGNPLAMAAGIAAVKHLREHKQEIYPRLDTLAAKLVDGVSAAAKEAGVPLTANRVGSMFTWFFTAAPVTNWNSAVEIRYQGVCALLPLPCSITASICLLLSMRRLS